MTATIHPIDPDLAVPLTVTDVVQDAGSVVIFEGEHDDGRRYLFGADHGPAQDILDAFSTGATVHVEVEPSQILGGPKPTEEVEEHLCPSCALARIHQLAHQIHELTRYLTEMVEGEPEPEWVAMTPEELL